MWPQDVSFIAFITRLLVCVNAAFEKVYGFIGGCAGKSPVGQKPRDFGS